MRMIGSGAVIVVAVMWRKDAPTVTRGVVVAHVPARINAPDAQTSPRKASMNQELEKNVNYLASQLALRHRLEPHVARQLVREVIEWFGVERLLHDYEAEHGFSVISPPT